MRARGDFRTVRTGKRCDFHFAGLNEKRRDANWKNHPRRAGRTGEDFSWSFRSRRLAFMCILCIYYGCLPGIARQNRRSLYKNFSFCDTAGPLWGPFRITFENPVVPSRGLINWHRDTCPAGLGGPLAFNDTRQSHRFRSLSSMVAIASLVAGKKARTIYKNDNETATHNLNCALRWLLCLIINIVQ